MRNRIVSPRPHRGQSLNLDEFLSAAVYTAAVVLPSDLDRHLAAAEADDVESIALVQRVSSWLTQVEQGAALRCLGCDQRLRSDDDVEAFAVISEFADPARGIISGLCHRCVDRHDDLLALVIRRAAEVWDHVRIIEAGRS